MAITRDAPAYYVSVSPEGEPAQALDVTDRVLTLEFEDNERKVDRLKLTVWNEDLAAFDDPIWAVGNIINFSFGYAGLMAPVREAVIRKFSGGRSIAIEAHARAVLMDTVPRRRTFQSMTHAEIVRQIAEENGYTSEEVLFIDDTDDRPELTAQSNYTDAQFIRKLAHRNEFEFFVDFDGFHFHPRRVGQKPLKRLVYYTGAGQGDILNFNVTSNLTRLPGSVRIKSRNPRTKETIDKEASNDTDKDRDVLAKEVFVQDPQTGKLVSRSRTASEAVVADESASEEEADRKAKGKYRRSQQRAVKMDLSLVGDPTLLAKAVVLIDGLGKRLSGRYYVNSCVHKLSSSGYQLSAKVASDGVNAAYSESGGASTSNASVEAQVAALEAALAGTPTLSQVNGPAVRSLIEVARTFGTDPTRSNAFSVISATRQITGNTAAIAAFSVPTSELKALATRIVATTSSPASGKLNKKEPDGDADGNKAGNDGLSTKITRDPQTGVLVTKYKDQGGREN